MSDVIIADELLRAALERATGPVPICAPGGEVLGYASPAKPGRLSPDGWADGPDGLQRQVVGGTTFVRGNGRPVPPQLTPTPEQEARLREVAGQQGVAGKATFENLLGADQDEWDSDEEFERFLEYTREARGTAWDDARPPVTGADTAPGTCPR